MAYHQGVTEETRGMLHVGLRFNLVAAEEEDTAIQ